MTHEDRGHYALKHQGKTLDPKIIDRLKALDKEGTLTCASAHRVARELNVSPAEVGIQMDLIELRLKACQMGLFGYGKGVKKFDPNFQVSDVLKNRLEQKAVDGRISCAQCWEIAGELKIKKLDIGSASEQLSLRIKPCQLGAF